MKDPNYVQDCLPCPLEGMPVNCGCESFSRPSFVKGAGKMVERYFIVILFILRPVLKLLSSNIKLMEFRNSINISFMSLLFISKFDFFVICLLRENYCQE